MSAENTVRYFSNFESEALPKVTWQEMLDERVVIAPQNVIEALQEAEQLLITHPGPNLERRKRLAPEWFSYWENLLKKYPRESGIELIPSGNKLVKFENLSDLLAMIYPSEKTGMLFVAGAEGHKGHIHAAKYMAGVVLVTIWGFEQDEYMQRKDRQAPFLTLPLRLSMWFYEPALTHLTVLPKNTRGIADNDHYNDLFIRSGAKYFFVHEKDPYRTEKLARGEQDLDRTITHPFPLQSTTEAVEELTPGTMSIEEITNLFVRQNLRVIPDLPVEPTSKRVQKLLTNEEDFTRDEKYEKSQGRFSRLVDLDIENFEDTTEYCDTLFLE